MWSVQNPLEIWVKNDFVLSGCRPVPLLMHRTPPDTDPELEFWNLLREKLQGVVKFHWFKDLEDAGNLVVTPNDIKDYILGRTHWETVRKFNQQVLASNRTLISFIGGWEYKPKSGEIAFAGSTYRCEAEQSVAKPSWLYDIGHKISQLQKPSKPTVGFVGHTRYPGKVNSVLRHFPIPNNTVGWMAGSLLVNRNLTMSMRRVIAARVRRKVIEEARRAKSLETSITERTGDYFILPKEEKERQRKEYIQTIQNNAYILVMRGDTNGCFQLWEVMSAGRIPIIIDTNQQFPDLGDLKWEEFSVIVPYSQVHQIGDRVQQFHDNLSDEGFRQACQKSRAAFEYLLPHNFILPTLRQELLRRQATR